MISVSPVAVQPDFQPVLAPRAAEVITATCTLPGVAASAAAARKFTWRVLEAAGVSAGGEAELCASELAGNALEHTRSGQPGGIFTLQVTVSAQGVRIEVRDAGAADGDAPVVSAQCPPPGAERGRGLWIIAALTHRFQFTPGRAWCEFDLPETAPMLIPQ